MSGLRVAERRRVRSPRRPWRGWHDLIADFSRRLDSLWRYDQYIASAEWRNDLRQFWQDAKAMEQQGISRLKHLVAQEIQNGCF